MSAMSEVPGPAVPSSPGKDVSPDGGLRHHGAGEVPGEQAAGDQLAGADDQDSGVGAEQSDGQECAAGGEHCEHAGESDVLGGRDGAGIGSRRHS